MHIVSAPFPATRHKDCGIEECLNPVVKSSILFPACRSANKVEYPFLRELVEDVDIVLSNGDIHTIKKGFRTDLGSVPRVLWSFVAPYGRTDLGFIVHDWLLLHRKSLGYDRRFIDQQMKHFHYLVGVLKFNMEVLYLGVALYTRYLEFCIMVSAWRKNLFS